MKKKQETFRNRVTVTVSVEMRFSVREDYSYRIDSIREMAESVAENWVKAALDRAQDVWAEERGDLKVDVGWPHPEMDRPRARCTSITGTWEEKDAEPEKQEEDPVCEECSGTRTVKDDDSWIPAEDGAMRCPRCHYPAPTHAPGCPDNRTKPCPVCADKLEGG